LLLGPKKATGAVFVVRSKVLRVGHNPSILDAFDERRRKPGHQAGTFGIALKEPHVERVTVDVVVRRAQEDVSLCQSCPLWSILAQFPYAHWKRG